MSIAEWGGCLLLSLMCGLDRTAFLQGMIARPIVVAPVAGWFLGSAEIGLQVGLALELVFLARLPVGATVPHDDTQMALGATVVAVMAARTQSAPVESCMAVGLLVALSVGLLGGHLDRWARHQNARLATAALDAVGSQDYARFQRRHLWGLVHFGVASMTAFGLICGAGGVLIAVAGSWSLAAIAPVAPALLWILPLSGVAACLAQHRGNRYGVLYLTAFVGVFVWLRVVA